MPDTFNTTRTPSSRSSAYDLVAHIAESNPHPQYLLKSDYQGGGSGSLDLENHKSDPNAHGDNYVKPAALNNYYTKDEIDANFYTKTYINTNIYTKAQVDELLRGIGGSGSGSGVVLYHDPVNDDSEAHAASMKAANVVYNLITDHVTRFNQTATLTNHLDDSGLELYAHRIHKHEFTDLPGVAPANHNHDDRYSVLSHTHGNLYAALSHYHNEYVLKESLETVGIYPNTAVGSSSTDTAGTLNPFDFNEETTQGNISIDPTVMPTAANGPDITNPGTTSFLTVVTNIVSQDDHSGDTTEYGERNCSQTLTTDSGIYYRIGHRAGGTSADYIFSDWTPIGGGSKDIFEVFYTTTTEAPRGAFPLWTGETITNCKNLYPSFWSRALEYRTSGKIRVLTSDAYNNEITTYGECGAFVIDETSGNIRLPKITRFISSLDQVSDIGITKNSQKTATNGSSVTIGDEILPKHVRLALYIQVYNSITVSAVTDLDARVRILEQNAIMFAKHDFTAANWKQVGDLYEYTFNTNHFTSAHIYTIETGGSALVDESVEVHIEGDISTNAVDRSVRLVSPQSFTGYIITLG